MKKNSCIPRWSINPSWSSAKAPHGSLIWTGPLDSPPLALRWSIVMQRKSFLNFLHCVEHLPRPVADQGVQSPAGDDQKRETRPSLLIVDADIALGIKRHCSSSFLTPEPAPQAIVIWETGLSRQNSPVEPAGEAGFTQGGDESDIIIEY